MTDTLIRRPVHAVPRLTSRIFLLAAGYTAVPLLDLPGIGLSLSAPMIYLVAIEVTLGRRERWGNEYTWVTRGTLAVGGCLVVASLLSTVSGDGHVSLPGLFLVLVRFGYWLLVFVIAAYVIARAGIGERFVDAVTFGITISALARLFEVLALSRVTQADGTVFLAQNEYGVLFSAFGPMTLHRLVRPGWRNVLKGLVIVGVVFSAAAFNGSRGSWVSLGCGVFVFVALHAAHRTDTRHRRLAMLTLAAVAVVAAISLAPGGVRDSLDERFSTFDRLEEDRSALIREYQVTKGVRLFETHPVWGVGLGRFSDVSVDIPLKTRLASSGLASVNSRSAHNSYVQVLAEVGSVGACALASLLLVLVTRGLSAARQLAKAGEQWAIAVYSGFVSLLIHLWGIAALTNTATWLVFGAVASMICAARAAAQN